MYRTFKYPLKPTKVQEVELENVLLHCQQLYNAALEQRISAYKKQKKQISKYDQFNELTDLRNADIEYKKISIGFLRSSLNRLNESYENFFRRIKNGEKPGFPRFKSKESYKSFSFPIIHNTTIKEKSIYLPKIGETKFHKYRPLKGIVKEVSVKKNSKEKWTISFLCDIGDNIPKTPIKEVIGLDLGLTHFATLSDKTTFDNPKYFKKSEKVISDRQRKLKQKRKGSKSRKKQKILIAKAHEKIKNQRIDFCRKLSCLLFEKYDLVCIEKLNILGMCKNIKNKIKEKKSDPIKPYVIDLNKDIYDVSWATFIQCLKYKAENAGKKIIEINPKNTSQVCSGCKQLPTIKKTLKDKIHNCEFCKLELDRDHNAALNIKALGLSVAKLNPEIIFSEQCN